MKRFDERNVLLKVVDKKRFILFFFKHGGTNITAE